MKMICLASFKAPNQKLTGANSDHESAQPTSALLRMISKESFISLLLWAQEQISSLPFCCMFCSRLFSFLLAKLLLLKTTKQKEQKKTTNCIPPHSLDMTKEWFSLASSAAPVTAMRILLSHHLKSGLACLEVGTFVPAAGFLKVIEVFRFLSEGGRQSAH